MGRRLRPLDPEAGAAQRFACELRALRAMAGEPPFWKMARHCQVSKSALAEAVAGRTLPSENVTRAFVQVCRGDWEWWRSRLHHFRELLAAQPADEDTGQPASLLPARRLLPEPAAATELAAIGAASPGTTSHDALVSHHPFRERRRRWFGRKLLLVTAILEAFALAAVSTVLATHHASPDPRLTVSATPPAPKDGDDPYTDGCGTDEQAIQRQGIVWPDGTSYGWLTMYYSHKCKASWGSVNGPNSTQWRVYITAHRSQDGVSAPSSFSGNSPRPGSWGNLLLTTNGCVWAEAYVTNSSGIGYTAKTDCYQETAGQVVHS